MARCWILAVLALWALVSPSLSKEEAKEVPAMDSGRFLFGTYQTTTYTIVAASTSTVFFSCNAGTGAVVCQGKKRSLRNLRKDSYQKKINEEEVSPDLVTSLDSSIGQKEEDVESPNNVDAKLGFTIWTTSRTTTSVTVFYTNTATTIRLTFDCAAGGIALPANNCA